MTPRRSEGRSAGRLGTGHGRETDLRRRPGTREQRKTVLIATNGESTERAYFTGLRDEPWVRPKLRVVVERGSPVDVLRGAARCRDRDDFDVVWAVCDVDHYKIADAAAEAQSVDVTLAWSNPCFEVGLLAHYDNCTRYLESPRKARDQLRVHLPKWDKTALNFADFRDRVESACQRAQSLKPAPDGNPSTAVWQIIDTLR